MRTHCGTTVALESDENSQLLCRVVLQLLAKLFRVRESVLNLCDLMLHALPLKDLLVDILDDADIPEPRCW